MKSLSAISGQSSFHLLVGGGFAVAFMWPLVVSDEPASVFYLLMGGWALSIVAAAFLSQGNDGDAPDLDADQGGDDVSDQRGDHV
jgi:hypothetical protein